MDPNIPEDIVNRAAPTEDVQSAKKVFDEEIAGLESVRDRMGESLTRAVDVISRRRGRLIVSGVGKSGLIAKKIAGTLTSTGTPSFFLHPVEAAHGEGLAVYVFTVDDAEEIRRMLDLGVDGLFTNHPQRMRAVLASRGSR